MNVEKAKTLQLDAVKEQFPNISKYWTIYLHQRVSVKFFWCETDICGHVNGRFKTFERLSVANQEAKKSKKGQKCSCIVLFMTLLRPT